MDRFNSQNFREFAGDCKKTPKREYSALPPPINGNRTQRALGEGPSRPIRELIEGVKTNRISEPLEDKSDKLSDNFTLDKYDVPPILSQPLAPPPVVKQRMLSWKALPGDQDIAEIYALQKWRHAATQLADCDGKRSDPADFLRWTSCDRIRSSESETPREVNYLSYLYSCTSYRARKSVKTEFSTEFPTEAPVTCKMLSLANIGNIYDVTFRHYINFSPHIRLEVVNDSTEARLKAQESNAFWGLTMVQLRDFFDCPERFLAHHSDSHEQAICPTSNWTIPVILEEITKLLGFLLPQRERHLIEEALPRWLPSKGFPDLARISLFLKPMLQSYCAPLRDSMVDQIVAKLTNGEVQRDIALIVAGLRELLEVIVVMALDNANHMAQYYRPLLLEDTVRFEQKFVMTEIAQGSFDLTNAHAWYETTRMLQKPHPTSNKSVDKFLEGLVKFILPGCSTPAPCTFLFDEERLAQLRSDMLDAINMEICLNSWKPIQASGRIARLRLFSSEFQKKITLTPEEYTRTSLLDLVNGSASDKKDKWRDASESIALQILKSIPTKTGPISLTTLKSHLDFHLSDFESPIFKRWEAALLSRLIPELKGLVYYFLSLSNERLTDVATTSKPQSLVTMWVREDILGIATKLAHLGTLHWRVWSNIAYLVDPDNHGTEESEA